MAPNPQSPTPNAELETLVRRVDEDRWLASRFAPPDARSRLIALYALNYEIARTAEIVTQPALGDMRLAWWREAIDEVFAGAPPRTHPALSAFGDVLRDMRCSQATLHALIDARAKDLDAEPFSSWEDLDAYLDATAGGVMRLGIELCGASAPDEFLRHAAIAWGCMGLARAEPYWRSRGRSVLPPGAATADMAARAKETYARTRTLRVAPAIAPALAYVSLTPLYVRALERGGEAPLLARQLTLIRTILMGRL